LLRVSHRLHRTISLLVKEVGKRYKLRRAPGYYVVRDARGRFKRWAKIPRSISVDKRRKAEKTKPRSQPGYGHQVDYPKG